MTLILPLLKKTNFPYRPLFENKISDRPSVAYGKIILAKSPSVAYGKIILAIAIHVLKGLMAFLIHQSSVELVFVV